MFSGREYSPYVSVLKHRQISRQNIYSQYDGCLVFFLFSYIFSLNPPPPHLPPPQICMSILHEMETVWHVLYV